MFRKVLLFSSVTLPTLLWIAGAQAGESGEQTELLGAPAGKGQARLHVTRGPASVQLSVCRAACGPSLEVALPPDVVDLKSAVLDLGEGRKAVHLTANSNGRVWQTLAAAPLSGDTPVIAFEGWSGLNEGEAPDRSGKKLELSTNAKGLTEVVVGLLQEDVSLCGRETLLSPQVLLAKDVALHRVKLQRFSEAERAGATPMKATPSAGANGHALLTTVAASSADADLTGLSDGKPETFWAEQRSGNGAGEFAVLRAPAGLPITGLNFTLRPQINERKDFAAPSQFWLATDSQLFQVQIPLDPWQSDASETFTQHIEFAAPIKTGCLALVLDQAFAPPTTATPVGAVKQKPARETDKSQTVAVADVVPTTSVDAIAIAQAISDLDGAEAKWIPARELLGALGSAALPALQGRYAGLGAAGRMRALNVFDDAPCAESAAVYVDALIAPAPKELPREADNRAEQEHITRRLRQCGGSAVTAGLAVLPALKRADAFELLALTLADAAPLQTVEGLVPLLERASRSKRRLLRSALSAAVKQAAAKPELTALITSILHNEAYPLATRLDVLRGLGNSLPSFSALAEPMLLTSLRKQPDYPTRYRALEPLARLAASSPTLQAALVTLLRKDPEPAVRAEAARLTPVGPNTLTPLLAAITDGEPRVREAAIGNLAERRIEGAREPLLTRIKEDPWPFVRSASVRGLSDLPPTPETETALTKVLESDASPSVRRPAALALGKLRAKDSLRTLRDSYELDRDAGVRAAAVSALAQLCDVKSLDLVTKRALSLATLSGSEDELLVAKASLTALGRLNPGDLKERLHPFFQAKVPALSKQAAQEALKYSQPCKQ